jgi:hypothetical protein
MITGHSTKTPDIQGLLLLDCWEPQVHEHLFKDKYYINLIEDLRNRKFEYMVNSASGLQINLNDPGMANTLEVCNYQHSHPILHNLLQYSGNEKTSALISRYVFHRQTINIITIEDFVWFCTEYLSYQIQHWLVVGHTWQMCTHEHTLGLPRLAELSKKYPLNFYATDYSFCTMTEKTATLKDFEQDSMKWCQIQDFGYQLLPGV